MPLPDGSISARALCSNSIDNRLIAPGAVTPTEIDLDNLYSFVEIVDTLPTTGNYEGRTVYLTGDNKLYRYDGAAFILLVDGADIEDGTIVASDKIVANSITADEIAANTITAGEIAAAAIGASELSAVNIGVGKYIRSTSYTPGSAGWSIDADGSAEFNDVTVRGTVDASDVVGNVTLSTGGVFRSAASGARVQLSSADNEFIQFFDSAGDQQAKIGFDDGAATFDIETINGEILRVASDDDLVLDADGTVSIVSAGNDILMIGDVGPIYRFFQTASGDYAWISADTGQDDSIRYQHSTGNWHMRSGGTDYLRVEDSGAVSAGTTGFFSWIGDSDTRIDNPAANQMRLRVGGANGIAMDTSHVRSDKAFGVGTGAISGAAYYFNIPPTTGTSAGAAQWVVASGSIHYLKRNTSSLRYKKDAQVYDGRFDILEVEPILYRGSTAEPKGEVVDGHPQRWETKWDRHLSLGISAEAAAAVRRPLAGFDLEGRPDTVDWNQFIAAHQFHLRDHEARIVALEAQVAKLAAA